MSSNPTLLQRLSDLLAAALEPSDPDHDYLSHATDLADLERRQRLLREGRRPY